jgi:hypothetical protein
VKLGFRDHFLLDDADEPLKGAEDVLADGIVLRLPVTALLALCAIACNMSICS